MIKLDKIESRTALYAVGIFICISLIYLGFISQYYNYDGTVFSLALRYSDATGDLARVTHPHHFLYQPLAHFFYKLLTLFSFEPITIFALQLMGIMFALLTLILFYFVVKSIFNNSLIALLAVPLLAFSYDFWLFTVEAEVYIMSTFFLLLTFWVIIKNGSPLSLERSLLLGLCFGLSVLAHITNIIFIPLWMFCLAKSVKGNRIKAFAAFSLTAAGTIGIPYLYLLSNLQLFSFNSIKFWLMGPTLPSWHQGSIGPRWSFGLKNILLSFKMIRDIYLSDTNHLSSPLSNLFFTILKIPLTLSIVGLFTFFLYHIRHAFNKYHPVLSYVALWIGPHFIFFTLWDTGNKELWVVSLIPFTILLTLVFKNLLDSRFAGIAKIFIIVFIAGIFSYNFFFSMYPLSKIENNSNYLKALFIKEYTPPNSLIVLLGFPDKGYNYGKIYIPYFAEREILVLDWEAGFQPDEHFTKIETKIAQRFKQNGQIYILSEALFDNPALQSFLSSHNLSKKQWEQFLAKYSMQLVAEFSQDFKIFCIGSNIK